MRWDDLYIDSTGTWLPPRLSATAAIAAGLYDEELRTRTGLLSVAIADEAPPLLAVRAANAALARSGHASADFSLLLYATAGYQGLDSWNPAAYVQDNTIGGDRVIAMEVRQLSNGGMACLELAAAHLAVAQQGTAALLVTADRFALPTFDRWRADSALVWGDAGTAVVLSRTRGFARVVSLVSTSDATLEGLHRGDAELLSAPGPAEMPHDINRRRRAFLHRMGPDEVKQRITVGLRAAVDGALADAGTSVEKISYTVLMNLGRQTLQWRYLEPLGLDLARTAFEFGRTIGHLGTGDQFAGLDYVLVSGRVQPGDLVLLVGGGGGYAWTAAVVEVLYQPPWAASHR